MGTSCPDVKGMRSICEEEEEGLFVFCLVCFVVLEISQNTAPLLPLSLGTIRKALPC
jgi:hypothetical protein